MSAPLGDSQKRAIRNYRARLSKRGLARFEVLGRNADRNLIRALARRLAENGPDASQLRAIVAETVAEIRRGILQLPAGKRRSELEKWFAGPGGPGMVFIGRVLPFDERAGLIWAGLMAEGRKKGRSRSALDTIIAATAVL